MGAPVLPYFGDQFLGIPLPTPTPKKQVYFGAGGTSGVVVYPAPWANYDGSYLVLTATGSIQFYNASQTLIWTLALTGVSHANASHFLCAYYCSSNTTLYIVTYSSTGTNYALHKFTNPLTSAANTIVGSTFTLVSSVGTINMLPLYVGLFQQLDGNLRFRICGATGIADIALNITTGAKISDNLLSQGGLTLKLSQLSMLYESVDSLIQFGALTVYNGIHSAIIARSGYISRIPINFVRAYAANITCTTFGDYVRFVGMDDVKPVGITDFNRTSFDAYLQSMCNALGMP